MEDRGVLQSCNGLMRALGAGVGIPELALDEAHCCTLAFDAVVVNFELEESSGQLFLYASLGAMPAAGSSALYEQLLDGNLLWKDTGGATLGLDREGKRVVLQQGLLVEHLAEVEFEAAVERFVDMAEAWTRRVSEAAAAPPDTAAAPRMWPASPGRRRCSRRTSSSDWGRRAMAISLDQFREKTQAGGPDADRLEVNRAGTGLHRKGMSRGGKAVEWMRDAAGARKAENRQVMHAFVAALKAEHGDLIGGKAETVLQGHRSKPLSSRQVRQIIGDADKLRNSMRRQNQETAQLFAPSEQNDKALGYMSAVAAAKRATGAQRRAGRRAVRLRRGERNDRRSRCDPAGDRGRRSGRQEGRQQRRGARHRAAEGHGVPAQPDGQRSDHAGAVRGGRGGGRDPGAGQGVHRPAAERQAPRLAGADAKFEQQVLRDMGAQIGKLDNTKLLKLYRTTLSADMVEVRLALANREDDPKARLLLEDLNSYEAMVHMEVVERSLQQAPEVDDFQVVDHGPKLGQLGALANTEKRAAHRELAAQSDSYLRGEDTDRTEHPGAAAKLANTGVTAGQVADALRSADLTVNLGLGLFAKGGAFRDPSGKLVTNAPRLKNIYELPQTKGPDYLERRKMVEYALEPATEQADRSGIDPSNHPISAGVNVGRRIAGAAPGYGEVVLVLKDSVKDRCTFTPGDSFLAFEARVTPEKIARYKAKVAEMLEPGGGLPEEDRKALLDHPTALNTMFAELDEMAGQEFGAGRPFLDAFTDGPMREVDPGKATMLNYRLTNAAIEIFADKPGAGGRHVTTPERMSDMIADFNQDVVDAIVPAVQDQRRINLPVNNYHRGASLWRDRPRQRRGRDSLLREGHQHDDAPTEEGSISTPWRG